MTTMIALVGEQQLPNYLPVRHYTPSTVVLLYTTKTQQQYQNLKAVLERKGVKIEGVMTEPYDISSIEKTAQQKLDELKASISEPFLFNLTGGTKIMSLAAYQIAARQRADIVYQREEGRSIIDRYCWQDQQLSHESQEELPEYLTLNDMLELYLGQRKDPAGKEQWSVDKPIIDSNGGHLFELAIKQALLENGYEALCAVKNHTNSVDIDVIMRNKNQIGIIEAKTGNATDLKGVQQLSYAMRYLGGTFTRPFLVLNCRPSLDQQRMCELLRIHIVSLLLYRQGMVTLPQEDVATLLAEIGHMMKAGKTTPDKRK